MKALLTNNKFTASVSCVLPAVGLIVGWLCHDFTWFARFGALLVGWGIVVLSRAFIAGTELRDRIDDETTGYNVYSREGYIAQGKPIPEFVLEQERNLFALGILGPVASFIGTVVWGFGDLLNNIYGW